MAARLKTSKAQRNAVKAYRERTPQKNFCVTMSADEYERDRATLTAHGLTPLKFWRGAMERLNAEPLQTDSDD